jgi:SNF2 family DNA or RNA helicase
MGLGKTVQALALLLHRRKKGPALVVAPMSLCRNWEDEARRFAPALAVHRLAEGDREACVENAGQSDVVITSYGLLASESVLLASRTWGTVIYDEAHALKNASTRRWSAAREIKAEAVVALSGTPVENHAGELHALFDLLVPGMLGSRGSFDAALGSKIADGDREAASLLRQLVRPFVLRRTKAQVLSELPPKTELLQVVAPSEEHRAFYEAVRRRAAEKIAEARKAGGARAGRAGIELLAEITRLRRAAIDPRLVGGAQAPAGSKLDALVEMVLELRQERRRALVFSQFLEVLDLARGRLDEHGVECRRLDGTMTQGARAEEVAAFQSGQGDVFLVSLKAGGVGMNLTAADVVILLDPWWNPAVEDQAAARAHRMGQARPVTVVRIVTEATIEEKVLSLHAKKRQLFDDVVTDADGGGSLDIDALASLLA